MKSVFIIGHYGGDNFGDEAMLAGLVDHLVEETKVDSIRIVSKSEKPMVFKHKGVVWVPNQPMAILQSVFSTQCLILGGGTHFHDDYNDARYKDHRWYLCRIVVISLLYRLLNRKVLYLGVGYGPFFRKSAKRLTRLSCWLAHHISVRDDLSLERLKQIGIVSSKKIKKAFDLAALHPAYIQEEGTDMVKETPAALGISVTSLNFSKGEVNDTYWYQNVFPALTRWYEENPKETIKIFVLRGGERESDFALSNSLYATLVQADPQRVKLVDFTYDTQTYIEEIKTCNHFLATRYHSAVLAYLAGCKLLIIPYHEKLMAFAKYIQLPDIAVVQPDEEHDFSAILSTKCFCQPKLNRIEAHALARENLKALA